MCKCITLKNDVALILLKTSSLFDVPIHIWHMEHPVLQLFFFFVFRFFCLEDMFLPSQNDWMESLQGLTVCNIIQHYVSLEVSVYVAERGYKEYKIIEKPGEKLWFYDGSHNPQTLASLKISFSNIRRNKSIVGISDVMASVFFCIMLLLFRISWRFRSLSSWGPSFFQQKFSSKGRWQKEWIADGRQNHFQHVKE